MPRHILSLILLIACGQNLQADPILQLDFSAEEPRPLVTHGNVQRDQPGPRPLEFPAMSEANTAIRLAGQGSYLSLGDPGPGSPYDFSNGDAITIEGWVNPDDLREGQPIYLIGKGRTNSPQFARDNQNWALRLVGESGEVKLSFLFATKPVANGSHWHRWTSQQGFPARTGWHHVAVAYRFGEPQTIRGWVNGKPVGGVWDMGGATSEPPVVDDDEIRIGNGYSGLLDAIAVHRELLSDQVMATRFQRVGEPRVVQLAEEIMPHFPEVPPGKVLLQLCEEFPTHERWLNQGELEPREAFRWQGEEFLLSRIPRKFDAWGIRDGWNAPLLVRLVGDVQLPAGEQQFLLRARGLSRLWVDGVLVARTEAIAKRARDGEDPVSPVAKPILPGTRLPGYHQQEVQGKIVVAAGENQAPRTSRVVLEIVVGGKNFRTETGETLVALLDKERALYRVLSTGAPLPLTDDAVQPVLVRMEKELADLETQTRRQAASSRDAFWKQRHALARDWAARTPAPPVPRVTDPSVKHPVDAFLTAKRETALQASAKSDPALSREFHQEVLPILREHCFRCHGDKDKGGLRLNSHEAVLGAGDSELAAVVPGKPAESEVIVRLRSEDDSLRMPPSDTSLPERQISILEQWIANGANWPSPPLDPRELTPAPIISDAAFVRRIYLDMIGLPPSAEETAAFLEQSDSDKRIQLIDRLLADERAADHWMSFWLDLLAENPSLLNASLNSTGPFRWFLYDSLRDHKPLDRMVTELLLMRGNPHEGGSAGFAIAAENDSPFAAKGHIIATAFLGIELQCARCHDSPYHSTTQRDLYALAAMMNRRELTVPVTSRVPAAFFEKKARESLIVVTLKPDEPVAAAWPFASETGATDGPEIDRLMLDPKDSRERLAALITSPDNQRFSRVIVNRLWKQLVGAGFVEPVDDWEGRSVSHPELLDWLAHQFVANGYDLQHMLRLITTTDVYQRAAVGKNAQATSEMRFFQGPDRRRLSAEQVVDTLHAVTGRSIESEELTFVHDGRRPLSGRLTLGKPERAWQFCDLKNERDRPSLSLPRARAVTDVLQAFGWTGARQKPISERETDPNVLQPGILANGVLTMSLTRAAYGSELAELAIQAASPQDLVATLFLRILNRPATEAEAAPFVSALATHFDQRVLPADQVVIPPDPPIFPQVDWFNHLRPEANTIQQQIENYVRQGPPVDPRLQSDWRQVYEDVVWSLINHHEFVWIP